MVKIEIICARCQRIMKKVNVNHTTDSIEIQVECGYCGLGGLPPNLRDIPTLTQMTMKDE